MRKTKFLLIFISILIILIIITLILLNNNITNYENKQEETKVEENNSINIQEVTNPHMYMTVKSCIQKYINYVYIDDNTSVYRIIDSEYINNFNITEDNVLEKIENIDSPSTIYIEEMYFIEKNNNEQEYYVLGTIKEENLEGVVKETKIIITVKLDTENMIYSIIPNGYGGPLYEKK